jgi:cell division protein ZapA
MKQLEVLILGQSYLLGCPDGGDARLLEAVERVDTAMCKIRDSGKVRARERIAVLAALNLAFDLGDQTSVFPAAASTTATAPKTEQAPPETSQPVQDDPVLQGLLDRLDQALVEHRRPI